MLLTPNYLLKKIELTDSPPDITVINSNWDIIDEKLKEAFNSITAIKIPVTSVNNKTGAVSLAAADVGLGNVTNESKTTMFASPAFTGIPTAPTAITGTNTTQIATTAFVKAAVDAKTNITGNAGTATKLATPRTINGTSFDGSGNIIIPASGIKTIDGKTLEEFKTSTNASFADINNEISKINNIKTIFVYRTTNINGVQVIEVGFKPKFIKILSVLSGSNCANYNSDSSYDGTNQVCISKYGDNAAAPIQTNNMIHLHSGGAYNSASMNNISETGFSINWTGTGTLPGGISILMKIEVWG